MNRDKREPEYPAELESQIIMRLPEEPAKHLRELLKTGDNLKNRLTIQIENDMRQGEVKLDQWVMHAKIVDLPTIVESLKTIDNKSFYKTADICQMMLCKEEPDQPTVEEESPAKNKKKDPYKVDKKFLWPHGVTPPTKNVRKRRFRKTLKKKYVEAPEIEKEVKRLLRADNEADSVTWEVIMEDDKPSTKVDIPVKPTPTKAEKKHKHERNPKREPRFAPAKPHSSTRVVDIFGEAVSDSELEEDQINVENVDLEDSRLSTYETHLSSASSIIGISDASKRDSLPFQFSSLMFEPTQGTSKSYLELTDMPSTSGINKGVALSSEEEGEDLSQDPYKDNMSLRIEQARTELAELKLRRQRTQNEIAGMDNLALRQRFQDTLHTLNQDIMYKEMEYQGMITLQNSEDI